MTEPETVALRARGRNSATSFCHLLIPAYNEVGRIARCLQAVYEDALPPGYAWRDWSVLDDSSDDGTASLALEWGSQHPAVPLFLVSEPQRMGKSARLSRAHEALLQRFADPSELVVVLDADALITPGSLAALLRPLADPEARLAVVWGADLPDDRSVGRWASVFQMELTLEFAKRLGDRRPRAYGRLFAYRLIALADFTWQMETQTSYSPIHAVMAPYALRPVIGAAQKILRNRSLDIVRVQLPASDIRCEGRDWPLSAETMVGMKRLDNLRQCLVQVFADQVPEDIREAGVWRGGASIFMRGVVLAYGETQRHSWVADSFEGLPKPEPRRYPSDKGQVLHSFDELRVPLERVMGNFAKYDLLDAGVHFLKGWFEETLPAAPITTLALLRLDGDMYSSTIQTLDALYEKVAPGGSVVVDDYGNPSLPCKQATDDFRQRHGVADKIVTVDWTGAYWRKSGSAS